MRSVLSIILIYSLAITSVFAQSVNPNDNLKIGNKSSSSDKGITFDTNDGVNNKKLLVEKISKKLKWDGNSVQIGDGSSSSDKELVIAGALKSLKYNGTTGEFEFNDDLKLSGDLKSDILRAINTEVAVKSLLRAEQGIKVGTGSNEIRVNAGNLEFSNDGVLYKKFGSGTGNGGSSGISILENASFEDGITTGWTSSGGTFSQETYTNSVEGSTKYARFVATGAGQYFETTLKAIPDNFSGGCQADFKKVNVSTDDLFKVEVLDSSSNVLTFGNVKKSSWVKFPTINFACPASGATVKLRLTSLAAGTIEVDDAYLGSNQNIVNISQAMLVFKGNFPLTSGCTVSHDSATLGAFSSVSACPAISSEISSGGVTATLTDFDKPTKFTLNNLKAGAYKVTFYGGEAYTSGGNTSGRLAINDGTTTSPMGYATNTTGVSVGINFSAVFQYNTFQNTKTFELFGSDDLSPFQMLSTTATAMNVLVEYFPNDTESAVNTDQASWFIDANIGGGNANLGTASQSSYIEITGTSLDLVNNISKGSAHVEITCANGFPSIGNTCGANNESVGIAFIPPSSGLYEACFAFSHNTNSANGMTSYFQVMETTNTSSAIVSEGGQRIGGGHGNAISTISPQKVCGFFNFSDTSKKTLRLMYEQNATSGTVSSLMADRSSGDGQRDINVTVRPLLSAYNRPILTGDQVTTTGAVNPQVFSFSYGTTNATTACTASPCSYLDQIGNYVTSVTRGGSGSYTANFGKTHSKVKCSIESNSPAGNGISGSIRCENCNSISFYTVNANVAGLPFFDTYGTVNCHAQ